MDTEERSEDREQRLLDVYYRHKTNRETLSHAAERFFTDPNGEHFNELHNAMLLYQDSYFSGKQLMEEK